MGVGEETALFMGVDGVKLAFEWELTQLNPWQLPANLMKIAMTPIKNPWKGKGFLYDFWLFSGGLTIEKSWTIQNTPVH